MNQSSSINTKLIDSLAQIILSLTDEERQLLAQKIQNLSLSDEVFEKKRQALQRNIAIGVEQLKSGEYREYDESSLPSLIEAIKVRR